MSPRVRPQHHTRALGRRRDLGPALAIAAATALAACGGNSTARRVPSSTSRAVTPTTAAVDVRATPCRSVTSGTPANLDAATARAIVAVGRNHLHDAVTMPLQSGRVGTGFLRAFDVAAAARVGPGGRDRAVLNEAATPLAGTAPRIAAVLGCTVLADRTGAPAAASLELRVTARGARGASLRRTGELLLVPVGSTWRITGYDVTVTRDPGSGVATTTSAAVTP